MRQFTLDDTKALAEILADERVMAYSINGVVSQAQTRDFIKSCIASYQQHGFGPWPVVDKGSDNLLGFCGLKCDRLDDRDIIHIGYRYGVNYWGQGVATECAQAVVVYTRQQAITQVYALIEPNHSASVTVAKKVGFMPLGTVHFYNRALRLYGLNSTSYQ
ncbi:GNAT family N-acetyltransferase [Pseudoalteromonas 'SMAR']|uniref:GNAT family N-acetyltransferase n=1 Tax=Pseudoalteromonas 'SMAR' TaxID=3416908 RepID=UPI003AF2D580